MELTEELKKKIDAMSYYDMLERVRYAPAGDELFQGEAGTYLLGRMKKMRSEPGGQERHVQASKAIGWEGR